MNIIKINRSKSNHSKRQRDPFYQGKQWKNTKAIAETEVSKLCPFCLEEGVKTIGTVLDHIIQRKLGGSDTDMKNFRWLCKKHDAINQARQANRSKIK
jgi:5-methylcytosine-specific restriction endonuclease McrA